MRLKLIAVSAALGLFVFVGAAHANPTADYGPNLRGNGTPGQTNTVEGSDDVGSDTNRETNQAPVFYDAFGNEYSTAAAAAAADQQAEAEAQAAQNALDDDSDGDGDGDGDEIDEAEVERLGVELLKRLIQDDLKQLEPD